jgi:hypothetical protein
MEDYNTATLPNKKFYNYELFLMQEKAKAQKGKGPILDEKTTFNDEEERKVSHPRLVSIHSQLVSIHT